MPVWKREGRKQRDLQLSDIDRLLPSSGEAENHMSRHRLERPPHRLPYLMDAHQRQFSFLNNLYPDGRVIKGVNAG
jgi:hypothetical protein